MFLRHLLRRLGRSGHYQAARMEHWSDPNLGGHAHRLQDPPPTPSLRKP
jgi:hypothetical protein